MTTTLAELRNSLDGPPPSYARKQLHPVPAFPVVDREKFILARCKGKVVLDIGASGWLHKALCKTAAKCYGIDKEPGEGIVGIDLDGLYGGCERLPFWADVELVVCGEVIEHLSNPGAFLRALRAYNCPVIVTVPNAMMDVGRRWLESDSTENVNIDHVAYYSWRTLKTLLERYRYVVKEWYWYKGRPLFAEGLIAVAE